MAAPLCQNMESDDITKLTVINPAALSHSPFTVYSGTSTGFLKGCRLDQQTSFNISEPDTTVLRDSKSLARNCEITCMTWWNNNESFVLTGRRKGHVQNFHLESGKIYSVPLDIPDGTPTLKSIRSNDKLLAAAYGNGILRCNYFDFEPDDVSSVMKTDKSQTAVEFNTGSSIYSMDHNKTLPSLIATGGKENPLKIWDICSLESQPIFTAKNVKNDWLNLRSPVWVTKTEFLHESNKIVTGTGYAQVRLYDPSSQRRPVIEVQLKSNKSPITALAVRPKSDFQLIVGTTTGTLALIDLRKKDVVKLFKGSAGGITDLVFHPTDPVFASAGIDCFVNCYNVDTSRRRTHSMYLHSPLNCLLFSSQWSFSDSGEVFQEIISSKTALLKDASSQDKTSTALPNESDDDETWAQMDVVQTKRRKLKSASPDKKRKRKRVS